MVNPAGAAHCRPLPTVAIRAVKYTHMHPQDRPFIGRDRTPEIIDRFMRRATRWLIIANIVLGLFTLFNLVIYPKYIYKAPEPIPVSEPVDQLPPYEV